MTEITYNKAIKINSMISDLDRIKDDLEEYQEVHSGNLGFFNYLDKDLRNELINLIDSYVTNKRKALEREVERL